MLSCTSVSASSSLAKMLMCSWPLHLGSTLRSSRSLSLCHCHWKSVGGASFEAGRSARFIKKLMTGSNRSRKKFFTVEQPVSKTFIEMGYSVGGGTSAGAPVKSKKCLRRVEVLNTVFMEQITSMMSTGEVSPEVLGLGLTITRVKISNDFSIVNVYWAATGTTKDDLIEPLLGRAAGKLRHELTQLRVIGMVPPIAFVKDTSNSSVAEVEFLLSKCDFGEDFEPTTPRKLFSKDPLQVNVMSADTGEVNTDVSEVSEDLVSSPILPVPTTESGHYESISMRQDVLGVRHDVIMTQIKEMMSRVSSKKRGVLNVPERDCFEDDLEESERTIKSFEDSPFGSQTLSLRASREDVSDARKRQQDFFKYLKKQQIAKSVQLKQLTTAAKDQEFLEAEAEDRWKKHVFNIVEDFDEEEDDNDFVEDSYYSNSGSDLYR